MSLLHRDQRRSVLSLFVRLCLFWVKITFGNAFSKMRLFGWSGKFYFLEIEIRWPKKKAFDHGNAFTLLFSLQSIFGKWERERARMRARGEDPVRDRELQLQSDGAIDGEIAIAISDRDHGAVVGLETFLELMIFFFFFFFFLGCGLCFPSSFPNTRKYFPENFLKCNQTHGNIFLFRKLAFLENMYFSENVLQQPNTALV